ncbi:MAG: hypothetical protein R3F34_19625 [Planctomycetota bacterium]
MTRSPKRSGATVPLRSGAFVALVLAAVAARVPSLHAAPQEDLEKLEAQRQKVIRTRRIARPARAA